ncbi:MAG: methyltransferase domain-containing protein, partial [Bacteroidetes bacterium]|nr:methyltransferase domain-containing protein [Bacteroidota bacterium]
NTKVRPTTDIAKEALFNIFTNNFDFEELEILDLFAGTGSISYEFSSRGVVSIVSVDNNFKNIAFIEDTAESLGIENISAVKYDACKFLKVCNLQFDIVFADPPYIFKNVEEIPKLIFEHNILKKSGWLVLEHSKSFDFKGQPNFSEQRNYGKVNFSFFKNT